MSERTVEEICRNDGGYRESPETAVGNLAIALGMLMAASHHSLTQEQIECYVESVAVLAVRCGCEEELRAFDIPVSSDIVSRLLPSLKKDAATDLAQLRKDAERWRLHSMELAQLLRGVLQRTRHSGGYIGQDGQFQKVIREAIADTDSMVDALT